MLSLYHAAAQYSYSMVCYYLYFFCQVLVATLEIFHLHVGSLVEACKLLAAACEILFPDPGSNLGPLHWERGVLATGPPRKSQVGRF